MINTKGKEVLDMSDEYNSNSLNQNHKTEQVGNHASGNGMRYNDSYQYGAGNSSSSGNSGSNVTYGNSGSNTSYGSTGNNTSFGSAGNNSSYGSTGNSSSYGNSGNGANYRTSGNNYSGNRTSGNGNSGNKKKGHDSFGKTIGKTLVAAIIFGLVAGGVFQGVNIGADRLRGDNEERIEMNENEDRDSAIKDKEDTNTEEATEETADSESDKETADNDKKTETDNSTQVQQVAQQDQTSTLSYDVAEIAENVQPSIVSITTKVTQTYQYFFQNYEQESSGAGSGIIIGQNDEYLYIATNYHVIKDAKEIKVGFCNGEIVDADVKGYDENRDVAVVMVPFSNMTEDSKAAVKVINVGDSGALRVGEPAIAIGNALGYGQSVTVGYISALDRSINGAEGTYIQTDAAINPGNSGGALINGKGELVGINSAKLVDSSVEGMGYAIPINDAIQIADDIINGVQKENVELGISGAEISRDYSLVYGFPMGIYVKEVAYDSPAEAADIHPGDIIVEIGGNEVYTDEDLQRELKKYNVGDSANIKLYRADDGGNYELKELDVTF